MKGKPREPRWIWALVALLLAGACAPLGVAPPEGSPLAPANPTGQPAPLPESSPTPDQSAPAGPVTLRLWLPPEMDATSGTPAAELLSERLHAFNTLYPGVRVEVRIKAASGAGGLLESLAATQAISPDNLPDLVAVSRATLEAAAIRGLLYPFEALFELQADADWYDYAVQLSRLQNKTYGLPFAGDGLVVVYRPELVDAPPRDWTTTSKLSSPLLFAAGSRQGLFTLGLYEGAGGLVQDEQGRAVLNATILTAVLRFYRDAQVAGVMPQWLTQYQTEQDVWNAFEKGNVGAAVVWVSAFLGQPQPDVGVTLIPTPGEVPLTPTTGWMWALTNPDSNRQALSAALAQFLTAPDFLAAWTELAGYLPPRPSALASWADTPARALASRLTLSARMIPSLDVVNTVGPALQQAVHAVLNQQIDPASAAETAARRLSGP